MKTIRFLVVFMVLANTVLGQSQRSFEKLVAETNTYLLKYEKLSGFSSIDSYHSWDDSGLPKHLIREIIEDADYVDGVTEQRDSISEFYLIAELQSLVIDRLEEMIAHPKFEQNDITQLLHQSDLNTIKSSDGQLYSFSLDEKTGGSYRSRISFMHFVGIHADSLSIESEISPLDKEAPYEVFEADGYDSIHTIHTDEGVKYVLIGHVRGCSYCFETNISLVVVRDNTFVQEFYYSINSRDWDSGILYDPVSKTIEVDYQTDDLTPYCDCGNAVEEEYDYEEDELFEKLCHCTFEFNGSNFELTKSCWEKK